MLLKLITAVIIVSSIVLSSAQPTPQCIEAYNATFNNVSTITCSGAYYALILGSATNEQMMMVCNASQQCNNMIENVINVCGNTVSY